MDEIHDMIKFIIVTVAQFSFNIRKFFRLKNDFSFFIVDKDQRPTKKAKLSYYSLYMFSGGNMIFSAAT